MSLIREASSVESQGERKKEYVKSQLKRRISEQEEEHNVNLAIELGLMDEKM